MNASTIRECTPKGAEYRTFIITQDGLNPYLLIADRTGAKGIDLFTGQCFFQHKVASKKIDIMSHLHSAIGSCLTVQEVKDMLFSMLAYEQREEQLL